MFSGREVSVDAASHGLADIVAEPDSLEAVTADLVRDICANSPDTNREVKALLRETERLEFSVGLTHEHSPRLRG